MKSLLLTEYNHLEITDMPLPIAGPGEVLVRVEACGICGSDVHGLDGSTGRRIPPIVMGHEAAGTVETVGEGVTRFAKGDRLFIVASARTAKSVKSISVTTVRSSAFPRATIAVMARLLSTSSFPIESCIRCLRISRLKKLRCLKRFQLPSTASRYRPLLAAKQRWLSEPA